jgi:hypothetical protein
VKGMGNAKGHGPHALHNQLASPEPMGLASSFQRGRLFRLQKATSCSPELQDVLAPFLPPMCIY